MSTHRLDVPELHRRLNTHRQELGLTWRGVGRQTGLAPAIFTRITKGRSIEADALITLLVWLDLDTEVAILIAPGQRPIPCPDCRRNCQPTHDGMVRKHDCPGADS